ncbi:MAG: histidinol-phosphate transaminase [Bacteroidota bacterium]
MEDKANAIPPTGKTDELVALVRPNIAALKPYSSARHEFAGTADVFLDANENPFERTTNRYPDPLAVAVKAQLSSQKGIPSEQIMLANGSDEVIDLLFRIFCEPDQDEVITLPPTYGMYRVSADINNVKVKEVPLLTGFVPDVEGILAAVTPQTKLLWLCSPNNPSGNDFSPEEIIQLLEAFPGIVIIDEAYVDFAERASHINLLERFPRLVIMQTFSKAWGMAGIRMGMAFASTQIIQLLNAVKPPYNVNVLSQQAALEALQNKLVKEEQVATILAERQSLSKSLSAFSFVEKVYPSQTNFLLVQVDYPRELYAYLSSKGIVVRDRSKQLNCEGCLRFTVGTPAENKQLLESLVEYGEVRSEG